MLNIAICDDVTEITSQLEEMIIILGKKHSFEVDIDIFFSGNKLLKHIGNGNPFDLIFLDIEMEVVDGIETGLEIRESMEDDDTHIAFISGKSNYAMELFQIRPINFLIKPLDIDEVENVLLTSLRIINIKNKFFKYKKGHRYNKIEIKNIMYFECSNRKVNIITKDGIDSFYSLINDVYERIKDLNFLYIHKSYIVNSSYIKSFMYDKIILSNDVQLPISQSRRKLIRDKLLNLDNKGG